MKVLIADDDPSSLFLEEEMISEWGYEIITAVNGLKAMEILQQDNPPQIALLDWLMPDKNGVEICAELRKQRQEPYIFTIILTSRTQKEFLIQGLESGADDYLTKPFDRQELKARLATGKRIVELQQELVKIQKEQKKLIHELQTALDNVKTLGGLLPICAWCKKIRNDQGYWDRIEDYLDSHTDAELSHGICPECEKLLLEGINSE
jgi:phosphoserine phosphatase RsbU/P